jgi:iron uptake system EfeUOB component EfeO/EfeM
MPSTPLHRRLGALGFVVVAVALAVGIAAVVRHGDGDGATDHAHIVGAGAAPPAVAPPPSQAKVYGSTESAQQVASGSAGTVGELTPLAPHEFNRPIARYRVYAAREAAALATRAHALTTALRHRDRAAAETAWARADSSFQRVGAAYGALGSLGDAIDGAPGGLPGGVHDPHFTGLRRIEQGLWAGGAAPASLVGFGTRLQHDVARLRHTLARAPIDPLTYATRAHEILEDVQRDRLSATTPSGSGVRAAADGLAATNVVLGTLTPLLNGRGDALAQSRAELRRLGTALATMRREHGGSYPPVRDLSPRERLTLDGRLGATLEALGHVPGELETTRPATIPRIHR